MSDPMWQQASEDRRPGHHSPDGLDELDDLVDVDYVSLRAIAATIRRSYPKTPLSTGTLVHEAWIRLASSSSLEAESPRHLKNLLVRKIRHVLVDAARKAKTAKHGGILVTVDDSLPLPLDPADRLLAVNDAIRRLEDIDPDLGTIVELRYFGGFTHDEIAEDLDISEATVRRRLKSAGLLLEAWLRDTR